jgi:hypothetical protein
MKTITIMVQSGCAEPARVPKGFRIVIKDYDIEGCDEKLKKDKYGLYKQRIYTK